MRSAVWLIERPRWFKRIFLIANDMALLTIAAAVALGSLAGAAFELARGLVAR